MSSAEAPRDGPSSLPTASRRNLSRGPLYMIVASLLFTLMIGTVKVARQEMAPFAIIFWRATFSVPISLAFAWRRGLGLGNRAGMLLRSLFGFSAMTCFFTSARGLTLSDLTIISKLQPILVALLAPVVLGSGEKPRPIVWGVLIAGLAGTSLIVTPGLQMGSLYGLWALGAAVLSAGAHISVRALGRTEDPYRIVFWFQIFVLLLSCIGHLLLTGGALPFPPGHLWPWLIACGLTATGGQILMTRAYAVDRAAPVAAAAYSAPLFGVAGDLLVFGTSPGALAIAGGVLIVGAGLALVTKRDIDALPVGESPTERPSRS